MEKETFLNFSQLSRRLQITDERLRRALMAGVVVADAEDLAGRKLFRLESLPEIARALALSENVQHNVLEVTA